MITKDVMRRFRRFKIELILIGMVLGKEPQNREYIYQRVADDAFKSPLVRLIYKACKSGDEVDRDAASRVLRGWGVNLKDSLLDSLITYVVNAEDDKQEQEEGQRIRDRAS